MIAGTLSGISYKIAHALAWILTHLVCRYRVYGRERVPLTGPLLIVANHLSWYDPLLLGVILPRRIWFFGKEEIFRWPVVGGIARMTGQIAVERGSSDRTALEKALAYLREGHALMIFPEGTVERQERMIAARTGVAMLALRSSAPVLPIAHSGTRRILRSLRSWFPRVKVKIGTPYVPVLPAGSARKARLQIVANEMMQHIAEMLPQEVRGVYGRIDGSVSRTSL